ncbi:hypothetical protein [Nonomuraea sp. NPDC049400]|uniref:hypothetical protein n=1 Tax=Nonomuraea sp. NPDC049400 TaxID=3364352 RepID=UPI0037A4742D
MTGDWLALNEAAKRLSRAWGRHVSMDDVIRLGDQERLIVRFQHGHFSVLEQSVSDLAAHGGDDLAEHADKPTVGRWARSEDPDAFLGRSDYEGDDVQ